MTPGIYAGLSNQQAFNIMMAMMECREELPQLEQWSRRRHWIAGTVVANLSGGCIWALVTGVLNRSNGVGLATAGLMVICVLLVTWFSARRVERRRDYVRALASGLDQFKTAATLTPGASADLLIEAMSH